MKHPRWYLEKRPPKGQPQPLFWNVWRVSPAGGHMFVVHLTRRDEAVAVRDALNALERRRK